MLNIRNADSLCCFFQRVSYFYHSRRICYVNSRPFSQLSSYCSYSHVDTHVKSLLIQALVCVKFFSLDFDSELLLLELLGKLLFVLYTLKAAVNIIFRSSKSCSFLGVDRFAKKTEILE